ncbi:MAG TPA: ferritin family protein [Candidatus Cloacimonadota bacterium]|jgi:rubrerythrin|nr:ferritin family protein [Candidatus Cloacimonadota bacterium]
MNRQETFRIAIEAEIRSQNLYKALAKSFQKPESSAIFNELVLYEQHHETKLRALYTQEFPEAALQLTLDPDQELSGLNLNDPKAVLEFAISREELAQNIYLKLAEQSANREVRNLLTSFAQEEANHKELLFTELERLHGVVTWYDPSELSGLMED